MRPSPVIAATAPLPQTFGTVGIKLVEQGWCAIPANGYTPVFPWRPFQQRMPTTHEAMQWARQYPNANVSVVLGSPVIALDCDSEDFSEALRIGDIANECFGRSPLVRVARFPRYARLYQGSGIPSASTVAVELKGKGRLLTVHGTNPKNGVAYTYQGDAEIHDLRPTDLPVITKPQVEEFWRLIEDSPQLVSTTYRKTGVTLAEALRGVPKGQRHNAILTIAYAARGQDWPIQEAIERASLVARRCRPPISTEEATKAVVWVYDTLPAGRNIACDRDPDTPRVLQIALSRALGGNRLRHGKRYEVLLLMCRDLYSFRKGEPFPLPQVALGRVLGCSQQLISKLIQRALKNGALSVAEPYRVGKTATVYRFNAEVVLSTD